MRRTAGFGVQTAILIWVGIFLLLGLIAQIRSCEMIDDGASQMRYSPALKQVLCIHEANECIKNNRPCMHGAEFVRLHPYCFIHGTVKTIPCRHVSALFSMRAEPPAESNIGEGICPYPFDYCFVQKRPCLKIERGDYGFKRITELLKHPQCVRCGNYLVENKCAEVDTKGPSLVIDQDGTQKTFTLMQSMPRTATSSGS